MYKIAIVDDERDLLSILQRYLSRDFQIETFENPLEALSAISNGDYDLVLSDIMMPQIDGIELLKRLRDNGCNVKVIMMTAFDTMDRALAAHKYGATNYVKKPFKSLDEVKENILNELRS